MKNSQPFNERFKKYNLSIQRLKKANIDVSDNLTSVIDNLLNAPDSIENRESLIIIKDIIVNEGLQSELQEFAKHPRFGFIVALNNMECDKNEKLTIESVWIYSKDENLVANHASDLANSLNKRLFEDIYDAKNLEKGINNNPEALQNLIKSINATEAIVQDISKATEESSKQIIIPEKRALTLIEQVQAFIEKITEKIFGKAKVETNIEKEHKIKSGEDLEKSKNEAVSSMSDKSEDWRGKIIRTPSGDRNL